MVTRQSELMRVLGSIADELPDPHWVALVDQQGLVMACVPAEPEVHPDGLSAMTAASVMMGERVLGEIDGGQLYYANVAGSNRQLLTVMLSADRLLSIGLGPDIPARATFGPVSKWVPELMQALQKRIVSDE